MFGTLETVARRAAAEGRGVHPDLRGALAVVLHELADAIRAFGRLVREEADPATGEADVESVRAALDGLLEARARITDLLLVDPRDDLEAGEVVVSLAGTVERLLRELDLEERARRLPPRPGRQRRYRPRIPPGLAPKLAPKLPPLFDRRPARRSRDRPAGREESGAARSGVRTSPGLDSPIARRARRVTGRDQCHSDGRVTLSGVARGYACFRALGPGWPHGRRCG